MNREVLLGVHCFEDGNKSTILVSESSIEALELQRFFILYHSIRDHYRLPSFQNYGGTVTYDGIFYDNIKHEYECLRTNKERVSYICDLLKVPEIFI